MNARVALVLAALVAAAPVAAQRVELPVRLVTLSDEARRFGVPLIIDGKPVEAGLDTGSTGLRVMARALPAKAGGAAMRYSYGSGTELDGAAQPATVAFGAASGTVAVQRVDRLACVARRPDCPVTRNADPATFGIQGDGLPGQGFAAILGINFRDADVPNPFVALGVHRWIIDLPGPGDRGPGRIILNPSDDEVAGYMRVTMLADGNSVPACLSGPEPLGRICLPATLDTGAPGIVVHDRRQRPQPTGPIPLNLTIGDASRPASAQLVANRRDQATRLTMAPVLGAQAPSIHLGIAPYWVWSVFYDADAHVVGLKPRKGD